MNELIARSELGRLWTSRTAIINIETTKLYGDVRIVEIACISLSGAILLDSLVNPTSEAEMSAGGHHIPETKEHIHGISDDLVKDAPDWADVRVALDAIFREAGYMAIYNASYDIDVLRNHDSKYYSQPQSAPILFPPSVCVMREYARCYGEYNIYDQEYRWVSLENAALHQGIDVRDSYTALGDALMTKVLMARILDLPLPSPCRSTRFSKRLRRELSKSAWKPRKEVM